MNEISVFTGLLRSAKRSAVERLKKAMELEKIGPSETARKLNILPVYISMALNEKYWDKLSKAAWDRILFWCNSGETIHHFKIPQGEAVVEEKKKAVVKKSLTTSAKSAQVEPSNEKMITPAGPSQDFTDTARLKVCLDIEINLVVNGQKVRVNG